MKKISVISGIVLAALFVFAFTFGHSTDTAKNQSMYAPFHVIVKGCDNCDQLYYCLDGRQAIYPGSCEFWANCNEGGPKVQTMCVRCGDKAMTVQIQCGSGNEVIVELSNFGVACDCEGMKKKK